MSHLPRTFSTQLRGELWRPTLEWVNYQSEYPRFMVKNANGENGFIYLRVSQVSSFMPLSLTMMRELFPGANGCVSFPFHDVRDQKVVDLASRIPCSFRISRQLALVPPDVGRAAFK